MKEEFRKNINDYTKKIRADVKPLTTSLDTLIITRTKLVTAYNSLGEHQTSLKGLTKANLINDILSPDFFKKSNGQIEEYLQEFHNRIAKSLGCPEISVKLVDSPLKSDLHMANKAQLKYCSPTNLACSNQVDHENMEICIDKNLIFSKKIFDKRFDLEPANLYFIFAILHETKHLEQTYNMHNLFTNLNATLKEDYNNTISYSNVLTQIALMLEKLSFNLPGGIYPNIKNPKLDDLAISRIQRNSLKPDEIDARKYTLEQFEKLSENGYFKNSNCKDFILLNKILDYKKLNLYNETASDVCPACTYLKKYISNLSNAINKKDFSESKIYFDNIAKQINFNKYLQTIQNYYDDLKTELSQFMYAEGNNNRETMQNSYNASIINDKKLERVFYEEQFSKNKPTDLKL